jgi:hypothetical protein
MEAAIPPQTSWLGKVIALLRKRSVPLSPMVWHRDLPTITPASHYYDMLRLSSSRTSAPRRRHSRPSPVCTSSHTSQESRPLLVRRPFGRPNSRGPFYLAHLGEANRVRRA